MFAVLFAGLVFAISNLVAAESYEIDPVHSTVIFKVQHFGAGYSYGRFNTLKGSFQYDEKDLSKSNIEIAIQADSVDTGNAQRDTHLKGAFFNAAQFPAITFKSTKVEKGDKDGLLKVTGDLTLMGVTKPVTLDVKHVGAAEDPMKSFRRGFETSLTIKRSDYGMKTMLDKNIGDEVTLIIALEGVKK
jgi:polyisoprenoid-binding protein YceI